MKGGAREEVPDVPSAARPQEQHDTQFSIRKKIDQYRNWHEEQYRQKIRDFKTDEEKEKQAEILKIAALKNKSAKKQVAVKMSHRSNSSDHVLPRLPVKPEHNVPSALPEVDEDIVSQQEIVLNTESPGKENELKSSDVQAEIKSSERVSSSKTWRTWRDVNDSYAYTDVKQYIKENELMDEEKEKYINEWIDQVTDTYSSLSPSLYTEDDTRSYMTLKSNNEP